VLPVIDPAVWGGIDAPVPSMSRAAIVDTDAGQPAALLLGEWVMSVPAAAPHVRRDCWLAPESSRTTCTLECRGLTAIIPTFARSTA